MNVVVDGLMTNYQKTGEGPVILMLHGWGDSSKTFDQLIKNLPTSYQYLSLDLPGFGGTQKPEQAWGLEDYADFVKDWLKKIGVSKAHAIIAHSNGGAIAIKALGRGKIAPGKLVLLASAGVRDNKNTRKKVLKAAAKGGKAVTFFLPGRTKERLKDSFYSSIGSEAKLVPGMEETFRRVVSEDIQPSAKQVNTPTQLIYGKNDKSTPPSYGRIFSEIIPGSKLEIIEGGHFIHQEQAEEVGKLVSAFLEAK
jgi:pimeloyl-ACP methyl ester carboxylesterase